MGWLAVASISSNCKDCLAADNSVLLALEKITYKQTQLALTVKAFLVPIKNDVILAYHW